MKGVELSEVLSTKQLDKGVKDNLRFTKPHLVSRVTSSLIKEGYCFLEGYSILFLQNNNDPYHEIREHLLEVVTKYLLVKLEK